MIKVKQSFLQNHSLESKRKNVIPSVAYRDEGMSYHYAPPSDYIQIKNADVIYRETRNHVEKRKDKCISIYFCWLYIYDMRTTKMNENYYKELFDDFIPVFRRLAGTDKYSITLSGSHGKGIADKHLDFDFMIFYEKPAERDERKAAYKEMNQLMEKWKEKDVIIDGIWPRTYAEVEEQLNLWLAGKGQTEQYVWTIWGYHFLTTIFNQQILEDTCGKIAQWKERLSHYPKELRESILKNHVPSLEYWRNDYHYASKVQRKDIVFLSSLNARLIHDIMQVIYALNEFYYPGDGMNLKYTEQFGCKPENFEERVASILRLKDTEDGFEIQYQEMTALIDEVLSLVKDNKGADKL